MNSDLNHVNLVKETGLLGRKENMKISHFLLNAALLFTTSCAHNNRNLTINFEREPASVFDSCKNTITRFFKSSYAETTPTSKVSKEGATDALNQVDRNYVVNNHKNNTFTTGRGLNHYKSSFNRRGYPVLTFSSDLEKIMNNPKAHWLDAGGGMGFATEEATKAPGSKFKSTLVSVETPAEDIVDEATGETRRLVIRGKFIEDIPDDELIKSDIITDMYGPMAYTANPDKVLKKYLMNLKLDGVLYIHLGDGLDTFGIYSQVVTIDGKSLTMTEWLQSIPGITTEVVKARSLVPDTTIVGDESSRVIKIKLTKDPNELEIPELKRVSFIEGKPVDGFIVPRMMFVASGSRGKLPLPNNKAMDNSLKKLIADFRTGEMEHSFLDEVEKADENNWAHFSNTPIDWKKMETVDASDDQYFSMGSKKITTRFKKLANENKAPHYQNAHELKADKSLKVITDHNGSLFSNASLDENLKLYLDSIRDDGVIVINMGAEKGGFSRGRIVNANNEGFTTILKWLQEIPGISVKVKGSKQTKIVTREQLDLTKPNPTHSTTGPTTTYADKEILRGEVVIIKINERNKIKIPKLEYLGRGTRNDFGIEVPVYRAEQ